MDIHKILTIIKKIIKKSYRYVIGFFTIIGFSFFLYVSHASLLPALENEVLVTIPTGTSLVKTSNILEENDIIRSAVVFRVLAQIQSTSVKAGTYAFQYERNINEVISRLNTAQYGDVYESVTFPEGITLEDMSEILSNDNFTNFNPLEFTFLTKDTEGYLFPDTYQFLPGDETSLIVNKLFETFQEKTNDLKESHLGTPSWGDIIIMASIIEKEATSDFEEQQTVAGILWKRIDQGIPMQVDAPFLYAIGKGSAQLRTIDLRTDGPYNTYTRKGLTPTPIGNPGLSAIKAALNPINSLYFFYLHDTNGGIHYGVTHNDHVRNKQRYL
ncbi:MAG: UPF0755 protein [Candidatus Paceibacteria bacterium]|jgi:UPF0755 protein